MNLFSAIVSSHFQFGDGTQFIMGNHLGDSSSSTTSGNVVNIFSTILDRLEDDQKSFLEDAKTKQKESGLEVETTIADLIPSNPTDIIKLQTVISSICMIRDKTMLHAVSTGFVAYAPNIGIVFCSAGHNFEDLLESRGIGELDKYIIHFGNIEGNIITDADVVSPPTKGKPMLLKEFLCMFHVDGSIGFNGKRKLVKELNDSLHVKDESNSDGEEDYCALRLNHTNVKGELRRLGLDWLEFGTCNYLDYHRKGLATIVGHPGEKATEYSSVGARKKPLRLSFGKEKRARPPCRNKLHFEYDSLGGNSGSPVIGRGYKDPTNNADQAYKVKGIHIGGNSGIPENIDAYNYAQKITKLEAWIRRGIF